MADRVFLSFHSILSHYTSTSYDSLQKHLLRYPTHLITYLVMTSAFANLSLDKIQLPRIYNVLFWQDDVTAFMLLRFNVQAKRIDLIHTPRTIITFKASEIRFTYRVSGILMQQEHVLCLVASQEDFFFLPGGRAELGEAASVSLLREMQEELGVAMKIEADAVVDD